ncbi:MAG: PIN domain-containing protein [Acidobacteria bacterium]|nr:PIN domain-containing protein [Acidobacteriota bacterium]
MEPTKLGGVVLDSSVLIAGERRGHTVREILEQVHASQGDIEVGISVVTIAELVHGAYRAKDTARQERRLQFIDRLVSDVPMHSVTVDIARLAGRIEGEQAEKGIQLPFGDLLIGATALHLEYGVATGNARDFRRIPGLRVVTL